ncbi:hypothetical protein ACIRO1_07545 [Streptomyces sp. NPDC102381]|uniref:hypothetical protein n=1 Tax=Streptomyces sp. NPDC102381 TaxID=3366164 RepID=UPI003825050F
MNPPLARTGPGTSTSSIARAVTDILQPRNVLVVGMLGIGAVAGGFAGMAWGLLGALCAGVVPAAYIEFERKRGTWGDRHVVDRTKRAPIFLMILASVGTGAFLMTLGHAPSDVIRAMVGLWLMTVVLLSVNTVWKISVDSAVASAVVALLAVVHSPWWLAGYAVTVLVCWSRVALRYHTVLQTVAGATLGALTTAAWIGS